MLFSREKFIGLGGALGVSVAGASMLAVCGGDPSVGGSASGSPSTNDSARAPGGKAFAGAQKIAQVAKVPPGSAVNFEDGGNPAVLLHLQNGKFVAYSAVCTHQGCTVAYQNGELALPLPRLGLRSVKKKGSGSKFRPTVACSHSRCGFWPRWF